MKKILIINRGEIASRVAKSVRELGHVAVGTWTDNEVDAPHLEFCDEWIHLKGQGNSETYLNQSQLLELIKEHQIDAVHPGYGFLAENAAFAKLVRAAGVVFIGPNTAAIEQMGDKAISKQIASKANVPIVPGATNAVPSIQEAVAIADGIGYPVLLKAVAGGGGRGMRVCENAQEIEAQFEAVQRESMSSFGNGDLLVEKFITNPHHIEVQILGDKHGNILHFFERECSIQRRHQKVIEEAPSPFIAKDQELRKAVCETAVRLAESVGYDSAGTVEFIMGEDKSFYFLEMNTRIQVEHPITEEITGHDLIAHMVDAAFGQKIEVSQEDLSIQGHSIECRICFEDPETMLPSPGVITGLAHSFPQGIRFDHCLFPGQEVTPDFDPMVGKLIATGHNRRTAIRKMKEALKRLSLLGAKTNIELHKKIISTSEFLSGQYTTNYISEFSPQNNLETLSDNEVFLPQLAVYEVAKSFEGGLK